MFLVLGMALLWLHSLAQDRRAFSAFIGKRDPTCTVQASQITRKRYQPSFLQVVENGIDSQRPHKETTNNIL